MGWPKLNRWFLHGEAGIDRTISGDVELQTLLGPFSKRAGTDAIAGVEVEGEGIGPLGAKFFSIEPGDGQWFPIAA